MKPRILLVLVSTSVMAAAAGEQLALPADKLPTSVATQRSTALENEAPLEVARFTISDSKLYQDQLKELRKAVDPVVVPPSIQNGGMIRRSLGGKELEMGATKNVDLFQDDAKYQDKTPMVKIDLVHLRF